MGRGGNTPCGLNQLKMCNILRKAISTLMAIRHIINISYGVSVQSTYYFRFIQLCPHYKHIPKCCDLFQIPKSLYSVSVGLA